MSSQETSQNEENQGSFIFDRPIDFFSHSRGVCATPRPVKRRRMNIYPPSKEPSLFELEFEKLAEIGAGSFGAVFKCRCKLNDAIYAIKKVDLSKSSLERGRWSEQREVVALSSISDHKNIIKYIRHWIEGVESKTLFICLEYADCGDLSQYCKMEPSKSKFHSNETELIRVIRDITEALFHIHSQHFVHCDVKIDNIFEFRRRGRNTIYKIGDLGLAIKLGDKPWIESSDGDGDGRYVAPEIFESIVSDKADIYSLGMSIIELGRSKRLPNSVTEEARKLKEDLAIGEFGFPCSDRLKKLLMKMIEKDPEERFSAKDILKHLEIFFPVEQESKKAPSILRTTSAPGITMSRDSMLFKRKAKNL